MKKNQTCIVRDCDSSEIRNSDLKFYPIPKEENVKKKWLKAINRSQDELTKRSKVCSKHFKNTDYTVTRFNYTMGDKNEAGTDKSVCEWKVLKTEVVPSLNLPEKSTFKIKISKKDNSKEVKVEEVKVKEEKDKEKPQRMPKRPAPPPVEVTRETPSRSRRQASKEALKQMQLLLDDENDAVEIASDEDATTPSHSDRLSKRIKREIKSKDNGIDSIVYDWFCSVASKMQNVKMSGKMIQKKASELAKELEIDFRASNRWLEQFCLKYNINFNSTDRSNIEIIPIDPVPPPPPKKKYKLSHRKSSDTNVDREVLVLKSITNRNAENTLELDCWVEPLEECQAARIKKIQDEEKEIQSKLDSLVSKGNAKVIHKGDLSTIIEISEYVQSAIQAAQVPPNPTPVVLNKAIASNQSYQLVMDPRLRLIAVNQNTPTTTTPVSTPPKVYQGKVQVAQNLHSTPTTSTTSQTRMRTRRGVVGGGVSSPPPQTPVVNTPPITTRSGLQTRSMPAKNIPPAPAPKTVAPTRTQITTRSTPLSNKSTPVAKHPPPVKKAIPVATPPPPVTRTRQSSSASTTNIRPSEENVEGGLATGGGAGGGQAKKVVVDLTSEDGKAMPDSKEIAFNKLQGKTYPSLVVVARPHLRVQDVSVDRPKLDAKVKSVLMHAPTKFTEWLIQQGLVRSEQKCSTHTSTQLKLGMYSDVTKFPYSGGYVWISECCPHRFVSVFSGSLFEGSPHPPMVILKLLYHWACQTNIQNVTQWVKVDNLYVKGMFTWLRAVTTVALHTHLRTLGGPNTKVEVGVISLGTTSQDGNQRQVKVEVLGVLETASKLIRLRAVEPQTEGDRNYKKRFSKILEPIQQWVHPESILVADLTVDKQTLNNMGFTNVVQSSSNDYGQNNRQVMEYLRRIVPRMFQNTLSLLSRQIIQQFLDELVWREWYGNTSLQAFDNLVLHLAEQTRYDSSTLINRLNRVAQFPFKNWALPSSVITNQNATSTTKPTDNTSSNQKKQRNRKQELNTKPAQLSTSKTVQQVPVEINRPPKSISPDVPEQMVPLENYYYGTIDNYTKTPKITLNMKCPFCKSVFDNNIQLMNHLFKHAHNVSQDAQLCRYCLTSVPTANDLLKHIATSHPAETKFDNGFVCLICETQYMNPFILGKHMSKEHCPSELPYQCGTCGYRCSNHKQAIDHFYKTHDNGPTIQCPFCLKSTTVFTSSRNINQNMNYFIQHLQKHQRKQFARRCGKCNLWFVQKDVLRDHQARMHVSQRGKPRLVPWNAPRNGVMVPKSKMDKYPGDADVINFTTLTLDVEKNLMCKECNTSMNTPKHFPSFESCQNPNCQYSTCCTNAMQEHNAKCSKTQNPIEKEKLPYEMFCICGYSDTDGNQMARHLAICERKSAYPSRAEAQAAIVTHSMLDVLGLVRKPDETKKDEADVATVVLDNDVKDDDVSIVCTSTEKMEVDEKTETKSEAKGENLEQVEKVTSGSKRLLDESDATETPECDKTLERTTRFSKRRKLNPDPGESVKVNDDSKASTAAVSENIDENNEAPKQEITAEKIKDNVKETDKAMEEVSVNDCQKSDEMDECSKAVGEPSETKDKEVEDLKEDIVEENQASDSKEEESIQESVVIIEGAASTSKEEEPFKEDPEVIEEASLLKEKESVMEDAEVIEEAASLSKEPVKEDTEITGGEKTSSTNVENSTEKNTDTVEEGKITEKETESESEEILNQELPNVNDEKRSNIESIDDKSETTAEDTIHAEKVNENVKSSAVETPSEMVSTDENETPVLEDQIEAQTVQEESTSVNEENSEMTSESPETKQPDESNSGDKKIVDDLVESTFKSLEDRAIEEFGILNTEGDDEDQQESRIEQEARGEGEDTQVYQDAQDEDQDNVDQEAQDEDQDNVDQEAHDEDQDSQVHQEVHDEDQDSQVDQEAHDEDQDSQVDQEAHDEDQDSQIDQEAHDDQVNQEPHNEQPTLEDIEPLEDDNKEEPENFDNVQEITKQSEILVENASNHIQEDKVEEDCRIETDANDDIPMDDNNKSQDAPDITTDDIHNFISDIVRENETDITTSYSDVEPASKNFDVPVTMAASAAMEVMESEEATPMETD